MTTLTKAGGAFNDFSFLRLNERGDFEDDREEFPFPAVKTVDLPKYLQRKVVLPSDVTDVFVWVHGWRNSDWRALVAARTMFAGLDGWIRDNKAKYPGLSPFVPAYVGVHWPSMSLPTPGGYKEMRDRAMKMTTEGTAEFLLAVLLGYIDGGNQRNEERKTLRAKGGYYVHCLGHSFGGRFLTAAIKAAATPSAPLRQTLAASKRESDHPFTIDSMCVLQMAAPPTTFAGEFEKLIGKASPLCGPIVLTRSRHDTAVCSHHQLIEGESGVGCTGALEPKNDIGVIKLNDTATLYGPDAFRKPITNVDASDCYKGSLLTPLTGAHSDYVHPETFHLIASLAEQTR